MLYSVVDVIVRCVSCCYKLLLLLLYVTVAASVADAILVQLLLLLLLYVTAAASVADAILVQLFAFTLNFPLMLYYCYCCLAENSIQSTLK